MDCVHVVSRLSSCPIVLVLCTIRCIVFPLAIVLGSRPGSRAQIVLCIVAMYTMDIVDIKIIVFLTGWMDGWTDGWMDGRMDRWMDG